jgi:tRNA A37 methylthiotransferase MiaB
MGRQYTIEHCIESIKKLQSIEGMKFYYDLIVGSPTETDEAFMETCQFVLDYPPSHGMVASFSRELGTPAYELTPLPEDVVRERHRRMVNAYAAAQYALGVQDPNLIRIFGT